MKPLRVHSDIRKDLQRAADPYDLLCVMADNPTTRESVIALLASGEARQLRLSRGLTYEQVARVIGVKRGNVCKWEKGEHLPGNAACVIYGGLLSAWLQEDEAE
jgi:DNA-binding XRE family transcriptional regulator